MNIISVKTKNLHKYITKEIIFNKELSIVIGINGSGKTSILKLIEAILKLDLSTINSFAFEIFELKFEHNGKDFKVLIERDVAEPDTNISFLFNEEKISAESDIRIKIKNMFIERKPAILSKLFDSFEKAMSNPESILHEFESITPPMFIGLNRRVTTKQSDLFIRSENSVNFNNINIFDDVDKSSKDSFDVALDDCKSLIINEFKRIKKYEVAQINKLRNKIITSSFDYFDFDSFPGLTLRAKISQEKLNDIMTRKEEILSVINNFEMKDPNVNATISNFFDKFGSLFKHIKEKKQNDAFTLEYILNWTQVERIHNLVKIIDTHKSELDEKRNKIDKFIGAVNSFFNETGKKFVIDSVGNIYFSIEGDKHKVDIEELSSGEKQLLIIMANMMFVRKSNVSTIIIDEPEISLHIRWQDMFIKALRDINSDIQLILATHSPDIIGEYDSYCTPISDWSAMAHA